MFCIKTIPETIQKVLNSAAKLIAVCLIIFSISLCCTCTLVKLNTQSIFRYLLQIEKDCLLLLVIEVLRLLPGLSGFCKFPDQLLSRLQSSIVCRYSATLLVFIKPTTSSSESKMSMVIHLSGFFVCQTPNSQSPLSPP